MKSFKEFLIEKDVSDVKKSTLYIACDLPMEYWETRADQVEGLENAIEIETKPHCTFIWCYLEDDYKTEDLFNIVEPLLKDQSFKLKDAGFEVFRGVEQGKQDCLVVRQEPPDSVIELQKNVVKTLKDNGIKFRQTFPDWKPHMTIAYFPTGYELKKKYNFKGRLAPRDVEGIFMIHNNGERLDF